MAFVKRHALTLVLGIVVGIAVEALTDVGFSLYQKAKG